MRCIPPLLRRAAAGAAALAALAGLAGAAGAADPAAPPSARSIIDRLKPAPADDADGPLHMRGVVIVPPEAGARPPGVAGTVATPPVPPAPPSVDFAIAFAFNSAALDADAVTVLQRLGEALRHEELQPYAFQIAGHTDATGDARYNQRLSERRAEAVRRYLTETFRIEADRLRAVGYGARRLLDPAAPESGVNRRVQVTNLGRRR